MDDTLIFFGDCLKALDDNGKVGGYLVRFGGKDLEGEKFTAKTYFGAQEGNGADCLFHHSQPIKGVPSELTDHIFAPIKTRRDDIGIFAETVLNMADEYEQKVFELVQAKKLGWSSGASPHMVRKAKDGEILRWPIVEGSLTPTPAEPRNYGGVVALKSLLDSEELFTDLALPADGEPFDSYSSKVADAAQEFARRARARQEMRVKAGRVLSAANVTTITAARDALNDVLALAERPAPSEGKASFVAERLAAERLRASLLSLSTGV